MKHLFLLTYIFISTITFSQTYEVKEVQLVATVQPISGINLKTDEFCPIAVGNKLYFTSNRPYNLHAAGENMENNRYFNIFYGSTQNEDAGGVKVKDIKLLSNKLNVGRHTGPVSFTSTGDTLFFYTYR